MSDEELKNSDYSQKKLAKMAVQKYSFQVQSRYKKIGKTPVLAKSLRLEWWNIKIRYAPPFFILNQDSPAFNILRISLCVKGFCEFSVFPIRLRIEAFLENISLFFSPFLRLQRSRPTPPKIQLTSWQLTLYVVFFRHERFFRSS